MGHPTYVCHCHQWQQRNKLVHIAANPTFYETVLCQPHQSMRNVELKPRTNERVRYIIVRVMQCPATKSNETVELFEISRFLILLGET